MGRLESGFFPVDWSLPQLVRVSANERQFSGCAGTFILSKVKEPYILPLYYKTGKIPKGTDAVDCWTSIEDFDMSPLCEKNLGWLSAECFKQTCLLSTEGCLLLKGEAIDPAFWHHYNTALGTVMECDYEVTQKCENGIPFAFCPIFHFFDPDTQIHHVMQGLFGTDSRGISNLFIILHNVPHVIDYFIFTFKALTLGLVFNAINEIDSVVLDTVPRA